MMEETYDFLFIIMDLPKQGRCSSDAWYPAIAALKEAKKIAKCPVGLITSLEENMPEKFAKDLIKHSIIPLTGLENSLAAVKALQNVSLQWKIKNYGFCRHVLEKELQNQQLKLQLIWLKKN